jgi:hypothetical protein
MTQRSKNLSDGDVLIILRMLDGWSEKLSWNMLIDAVEKRLSSRYTRQALNNYPEIKAAFARRKNAFRGQDVKRATSSNLSPEMVVLSQENERLRSENTRLIEENDTLKKKFVLWSYNAYTQKLDEDFLNQPLPRIDREVSKKYQERPNGNVKVGKKSAMKVVK